MRKRHPLFYHISIFVLAQIAWLMLLGIWIYWYVSNYIIFEKVGDQLSPQIIYEGINVFAFVGGIVLLVSISFGMSLTFRHLNVQLKLNKLYDNFIGNVTHELKSPLSSIQLYLETLNKRDVPKSKQKEFYELMTKDANRLKKLIDSILEISSREQKKLVHDYHIYNANTLVKKLINESAEQFKLSESAFEINGDVDFDCVIDKSALKIVFDNLIDNAIKYSVRPLKIRVDIKSSGKKLIVDFSDNGIGILPTDQKKVFNKFHRIYNKNVPNVKGTGLGLYWVKEIIKNHGGNIFVLNTGTKDGTTFRIELPIYQSSKKRYIKRLLSITNKREKQAEL